MPALGVRSGFPTVKSFVKNSILAYARIDEVIGRLQAYGAGVAMPLTNPYLAPGTLYGIANAHGDLELLDFEKYWRAIEAALRESDGWLTQWRAAVAVHYWQACYHHAVHLRGLQEFAAGRVQQKPRMMYLNKVGFAIGNCIALGWFDYAADLALRAFDALKHGFFIDVNDTNDCCQIQFFLLHLVCSWQGWDTLDERIADRTLPLYAEFLRDWRAADAADILPIALAACDRHTHQACFNTKKKSFELPKGEMWYVPFEILSVLRLRESAGLPNPALDHPLMQTALGRLPPLTAPYSDDFLKPVLAQMDREMPLPRMSMPTAGSVDTGIWNTFSPGKKP